MWANQLNATFGKTVSQLATVSSFIVDQFNWTNSVAALSISRSINFTSDGLADSISLASGKPFPSTNAIILEPLPRLVVSTRSLFCRGKCAIGESFIPIQFAATGNLKSNEQIGPGRNQLHQNLKRLR